MKYKQYLNNEYRLLVKTQMFLTLDVQVVKFTSENSDYFYEKLVDKFFKNEQDVDLFKYHYNPIRMMDLVVDVHDSLSTSRIRVGRKKYNEVNIDSHDDGYNMTFDNSISDVFILQMKRFDKDNYIAPLAVRVDKKYLLAHNNKLDLSFMLQELDSTDEIVHLMGKMKKAIFI